MTRIWQDFRGGTDLDPVTKPTMEPGGIPASFIIIENVDTTGTDIQYSFVVGDLFGYPMGCRVTWRGVATYLRWDEPSPDVSLRYVARFPIYFGSTPPVFTPWAQMRNSSGSMMGVAGVDTSNRLYWGDSAAITPPAERFQGAIETLYWVQLAVTAGTTTSDGVVEGFVEDDAGVTLHTWSNTAANTGTLPISHYRVGMPGTDGAVTTDYVIPLVGLVMGDLDTGWWPYLAPNNINIRPIPSRLIGPGEDSSINAELWNQETGATWAWTQPSGPDLTLTNIDETASVIGPDRWNGSSPTPDATDIGLSPAIVEVTATLAGESAPPVQVPVDVLPQITWTRAPSGDWVGAKVAPYCDESM